MKKLSQKEILDEGFGSMMKSLARGAAGLAKGTAKMISPTAAAVAKSAADKVGGAIGNIMSSPTSAIKEYFNRPETKSKYDRLKIGKETKLNKFRRQIELEFRDVVKNKQIKTTAEAYRTDEGGTSPETWSFEKIKTADGSSIGPDGKKSGEKYGSSTGPDGKRGGKKDGELIDGTSRGSDNLGVDAAKGLGKLGVDAAKGLGGLGVDAAKGLGGLGVDAAKGTGDLAKQGVKRVSSDKYEKAKEMPSPKEWEQLPEDEKFAVRPPPLPSAEEPPPLPSAEEPPPLPSADEPQPTAPTRDDVEAAIAATNLKGFDRATEDKLAIKKIRDYLKTKSPRNAPSLTWAEYLGPEGRGKRGPTIDGREIPIVAAREIVAESKKSQKSLLKHLQSMSR